MLYMKHFRAASCFQYTEALRHSVEINSHDGVSIKVCLQQQVKGHINPQWSPNDYSYLVICRQHNTGHVAMSLLLRNVWLLIMSYSYEIYGFLHKKAVNNARDRVQNTHQAKCPSRKKSINRDKQIHLKTNTKGMPWHVPIISAGKAKAWQECSWHFLHSQRW